MIATLTIITTNVNEKYGIGATLECPMEASYSYGLGELRDICRDKEFCDLDGQTAAVIKHHLEMGFEEVHFKVVSQNFQQTKVEVKLRCRPGTRIG